MAKVKFIPMDNNCDFQDVPKHVCKDAEEFFGWMARVPVMDFVMVQEGTNEDGTPKMVQKKDEKGEPVMEQVKDEKGELKFAFEPFQAEACGTFRALKYSEAMELANALPVAKQHAEDWTSGKRPVSFSFGAQATKPKAKTSSPSGKGNGMAKSTPEQLQWDKDVREKMVALGEEVNERGALSVKYYERGAQLVGRPRPE